MSKTIARRYYHPGESPRPSYDHGAKRAARAEQARKAREQRVPSRMVERDRLVRANQKRDRKKQKRLECLASLLSSTPSASVP